MKGLENGKLTAAAAAATAPAAGRGARDLNGLTAGSSPLPWHELTCETRWRKKKIPYYNNLCIYFALAGPFNLWRALGLSISVLR